MERTFTLEEANALLPQLEPVLRSAMAAKQHLDALQSELHSVRQRVSLSGGSLLNIRELDQRKGDLEKATESLGDALLQVEAMGVLVKDLDIGLLDFPCVMGDEVVLLCWKLGEDGIHYWHGKEEGFKGRKPIDERIPRSGREPS